MKFYNFYLKNKKRNDSSSPSADEKFNLQARKRILQMPNNVMYLRCTNLWRACMDSIIEACVYEGKKTDMIVEKRKCLSYVDKKNASYQELCHLASLNEDYAFRKIKHLLNKGPKLKKKKRTI